MVEREEQQNKTNMKLKIKAKILLSVRLNSIQTMFSAFYLSCTMWYSPCPWVLWI